MATLLLLRGLILARTSGFLHARSHAASVREEKNRIAHNRHPPTRIWISSPHSAAAEYGQFRLQAAQCGKPDRCRRRTLDFALWCVLMLTRDPLFSSFPVLFPVLARTFCHVFPAS